jgi:uncharacterized protein YsxB (DUF464 family)
MGIDYSFIISHSSKQGLKELKETFYKLAYSVGVADTFDASTKEELMYFLLEMRRQLEQLISEYNENAKEGGEL